MVEIIETRILYNRQNNTIYDHQSRVVVVDSWEQYVDAIKNYNGKKIEFESIDMPGATLLGNRDIYDLIHDDYHLSYRCISGNAETLCFAYKRHLDNVD